MKKIGLELSFSIEEVAEYFDRVYFQRGLDYFESGKVISFRQEGDVITGIVRGKRKYEVEIRISHHKKRWDFFSICSCPMEQDCKHVVAVLLAYAEQGRQEKALHLLENSIMEPQKVNYKKTEPSPISYSLTNWLQQSSRLSVETDPVENKAREKMLYLLDLKNSTISLNFAKPLKKGGYGVYKGFHGEFEYAENVDIEIFTELMKQKKLSFSYLGSSYEFKLHGLESELFEKILNTGRVFIKEKPLSSPLSLTNERTAEVDWIKAEGQLFKPMLKYQKTFIEPVFLDSVWFFDPIDECMGKLNVQTDSKMLKHLFSLPPLNLDEMKKIWPQFECIAKQWNFPLPALPQEVVAEPTKPIAELSLNLREVKYYKNNKREVLSVPYAKLSFIYGIAKVAWYSSQAQAKSSSSNKIIYYNRDTEAENQALKELAELKLVTANKLIDTGIIPGFYEPGTDFIFSYAYANIENFKPVIKSLREKGWKINISNSFPLQEYEEDYQWYSEFQEIDSNDWFNVELGIDVLGERINLLPLLLKKIHSREIFISSIFPDSSLVKDEIVQLPSGVKVKIPYKRISSILKLIQHLLLNKKIEKDKLRLNRYDLQEAQNIFAISAYQMGGERIQKILQKLENYAGLSQYKLPPQFKGELRHYQAQGVNWLQFLREYDFHGILADDMGLGKTIQSLANLAIEKYQRKVKLPSLIVAPTSLMFNWLQEANQFLPDIKVVILQGQERKKYYKTLDDYDIILTTYPLLYRDQEVLKQQKFHYIILDEAQAIKNAQTQAAKVLFELQSNHRLCLTGTPIENHFGEVWSQFNFLMPGFLGSANAFTRGFRIPIEKQNNAEVRQYLTQRLAPFILRRTKAEIAKELPPKTEILQWVELSGEVRDLYETVRLSMQKKLQEKIASLGFARSRIAILDALLKLRQICCDHRLLKIDAAKKVSMQAPKLSLLLTLLKQLISEGRRILVFSQFTEMLALIEKELVTRSWSYEKLTGETRDRKTPIKNFQQGKSNLFLISLKAGGVGLNLTAADVVIHYDPWWNPAAENQATDRAHRIGQNKSVFVYKLLIKDSVEEKILSLQSRKKELADSLLDDTLTQQIEFSPEDLKQLFSFSDG